VGRANFLREVHRPALDTYPALGFFSINSNIMAGPLSFHYGTTSTLNVGTGSRHVPG
jgi:hypothetical protein